MAKRPKNESDEDEKIKPITPDEELMRKIIEHSRAKHAGQEERLLAVLGLSSEENTPVNEENLRKFLIHLKENLEKPCIVNGIQDFRWEEFYVFGPGSEKEYKKLKKKYPSYTDEFEILGFYDELDEMEGIFVWVRRISDKKKFDLPLADLKAVDKDSKNYQLLDDYAFWFVNN
jgi:hypothetical protein